MCNPSRDALRWCHLDPVPPFTLIHWACSRHCSLPSPFDQGHTVPDRLSHSLSITLVEKARLHLTKKREEHDFQDIFSMEHVRGDRAQCARERERARKGRNRKSISRGSEQRGTIPFVSSLVHCSRQNCLDCNICKCCKIIINNKMKTMHRTCVIHAKKSCVIRKPKGEKETHKAMCKLATEL